MNTAAQTAIANVTRRNALATFVPARDKHSTAMTVKSAAAPPTAQAGSINVRVVNSSPGIVASPPAHHPGCGPENHVTTMPQSVAHGYPHDRTASGTRWARTHAVPCAGFAARHGMILGSGRRAGPHLSLNRRFQVGLADRKLPIGKQQIGRAHV